MKKIKDNNYPTKNQIERFVLLSSHFNITLSEIKELSKKKPDDALNLLKIKKINNILSKLKEILQNEASFEFLDLLDENTLPSNSDAVLILAQYKAAMDKFSNDYWYSDEPDLFSKSRWHTKENP